jgi:hypothetical protein
MNKNDVMRQLASEIGAEYAAGGFIQRPKVMSHFKNWTIILDIIPITHTTDGFRMRVPFVSADGFRFTVHDRQNGFEISRGPTIPTGNPEFDRDFDIRASDPARALALFANPKIRQLMMSPADESLRIVDHGNIVWDAKVPDEILLLWFLTHKNIENVEYLKSLFESFTETLDQLCALGAATEAKPNFAL